MIKKDYIEVVYNETDVPFTSYPKKLTKYLSKKYNIQKKNYPLSRCRIQGFHSLIFRRNWFKLPVFISIKKICRPQFLKFIIMASEAEVMSP